jgi:hypothetical protein
MEYKILIEEAGAGLRTDFARAAEALSLKVNAAIREGWEPQGGLTVGKTRAMEVPYLMQAMVKKE